MQNLEIIEPDSNRIEMKNLKDQRLGIIIEKENTLI